jgi:hypothetical protein
VRQRRRREEERVEVVRATHRGHALSDHRGVSHGRVVHASRRGEHVVVLVCRGAGSALERQLRGEGRYGYRRRRDEQPPAGEARFSHS